MERAKFRPPPYLVPTNKGAGPFHTWCLDLVTHLYPAGPSGETYLAVAVYAFSKWVEVGVLQDRSSETVTRWFYREITCCFGTPAAVRTDRGKEFMGEFGRYLARLGVQQQVISVGHPRANGLVERYNGVLKSGLRRMMAADPSGHWINHLPDVLAGLRFLPTILGYSPFLLVYK